MIHLSEILNWLHQKAVYLPHIIGTLSVLVIIALIILGRLDLISKAGVILFPLIIISAVLIYNRKSLTCKRTISGHALPPNILTKLFFIVTSLEIIWLLIGSRDIIQLGLLFVMYLLIILQIFSKNVRPVLLLAEIMLTTAILVLPQLYVAGYFYADTDLIGHSNIVTIISNYGGLPEEMFGNYQFFCLYHILTSAASQMIGFVSNDALYLVSTVAVIGSIPIIYLIARYFTKSSGISVLAAFFYSTMPMIFGALLTPAPRVMASMAFFIALYFLFTATKKTAFRFVFLTILVITYMTGVHHAQIMLIFAVLAFLCLGSLLYCRKLSPGNITIFAVIVLLPIVWQVYEYLGTVIHSLETRLFGQLESGAVADTILESRVFEFDWYSLLVNLSSGVPAVLIFTGLYFLLTKLQRPKKICLMFPLLLVLFVFFVPGIVDVVPTISNALQLYRFRILLTLFFALAMAIGCYVLIHLSKERKKQIASISIVIVLCGVFVFSSAIVSYSNPSDVHYEFGWVSADNHYTEADEALFAMTAEHLEEGSTIVTNREYSRHFTHMITGGDDFGMSTKFNSDMTITRLLTVGDVDTSKYPYILFPYERYQKIGLIGLVGKSEYVENEYEDIKYSPESYSIFKANTHHHKEIYDNGEDILFKY